jgi:hypothetical protein
MLRNVQCVEAVIFGLYLWTGDYFESERAEYLSDAIFDDSNWMDSTQAWPSLWERQIDILLSERLLLCFGLELAFAVIQTIFDFCLQLVQRRGYLWLLLGRYIPQLLEELPKNSLLGEPVPLHEVDVRFRPDSSDLFLEALSQLRYSNFRKISAHSRLHFRVSTGRANQRRRLETLG